MTDLRVAPFRPCDVLCVGVTEAGPILDGVPTSVLPVRARTAAEAFAAAELTSPKAGDVAELPLPLEVPGKLVLVGIGLVAGLTAAVSFSQLAAKLLFGVQPHDAVTFAAAAAVLIIVAAAASYAPARRATGVEPLTALRYE